jgi:hypothetical protein
MYSDWHNKNPFKDRKNEPWSQRTYSWNSLTMAGIHCLTTSILFLVPHSLLTWSGLLHGPIWRRLLDNDRQLHPTHAWPCKYSRYHHIIQGINYFPPKDSIIFTRISCLRGQGVLAHFFLISRLFPGALLSTFATIFLMWDPSL